MIQVHVERRDRVAVLTLDDRARRNALSLAMAEAVADALSDLAAEPELAAVVVTGRPPAFSAGADLDDLAAATPESLARIYDGFLALARFPLPTVAAVNGPAVGAGFNLALACDLRMAGRSARFESRFLDLALHPGGGHLWMLERLIGPQGAAALAMLGQALDGAQAVRRGLAWEVVEDERLVDAAVALASRAGAAPRELLERMKATLREAPGIDEHDEAVRRELEDQYWSTTRSTFRERLAALQARIARRSRS